MDENLGVENILDQIETLSDLGGVGVGVKVPLAAEPSGPKPAIQKINYSHDGMINLLLANRGISQNEIARHFGYSPSWVSQVMSSDAFQARLMERAAE